MSLGVVISGPEGVVLAADSRVTLEAQTGDGPTTAVNFDNATKLLSFTATHANIGVVTYGRAVIGLRTAYSFVPEFELTLNAQPSLPVVEFSSHLSDFFMERWREGMQGEYVGADMMFIVGGYDPDAAYGKVFLIQIPSNPQPIEQHPGGFGMTWGGQLQIASRLVHGFDPALPDIMRETLSLEDDQVQQVRRVLRSRLEFPIPYQVLPLQDGVDLATFMIRSTINMQNLAVGVRGVGGPIEVAVVTRTGGLQFVQRKRIHGENPRATEE